MDPRPNIVSHAQPAVTVIFRCQSHYSANTSGVRLSISGFQNHWKFTAWAPVVGMMMKYKTQF